MCVAVISNTCVAVHAMLGCGVVLFDHLSCALSYNNMSLCVGVCV